MTHRDGPHGGEDTRRLLRLNLQRFTLVDLPDKQARWASKDRHAGDAVTNS